MADWIGVAFFVLLIVGAAVGLKLLSRPQTRTAEEFERNALRERRRWERA
ncbi:MAG: hypothetical protein IPM59_12110 [Chloracidobacterium sp.]|nr:hypothetical protein [Chloracidobacterium sp.]